MQLNKDTLANRVALITGAGRGIGRALAIEFAAQGATVAAVARTVNEINETASSIRSAGGRAIAIKADVTDEAAVQHAVEHTQRELGSISILVNNAGISGPTGPLWENDASYWWRTIETHLRGAYLFTQAVLPGMIARGGGHVLTIASGAAIKRQPYFSAYGVAKAAQVRLMETLAEEAREHGIVAFSVSPGLVYTDMVEAMIEDPAVQKWRPEYVERVIQERDHANPADAVQKATALCVRLASGNFDAFSGGHYHPIHDWTPSKRRVRRRRQ